MAVFRYRTPTQANHPDMLRPRIEQEKTHHGLRVTQHQTMRHPGIHLALHSDETKCKESVSFPSRVKGVEMRETSSDSS